MLMLMIRRINLHLILILILPASVYSLNSDGQTLLSLARHWTSLPPTWNWNASDAHPCSWFGVVCSDHNHLVVSLNLSSSHIVGELGPEIERLTQLRSLNLSCNRISGTIPSQIANCTLLHQLDLSLNTLSGNIPHTLAHLFNLRYLSLFNNSLNGSLPDSIFRIPTLEHLLLGFNRLTGLLPSNLGNATMLQHLSIDNNHFTGSLPHTLNNLTNLVYLDVNRAGLQLQGGTIPLGSSCKSLTYLDLSFNNFFTALPPHLGNCTNLQQFAAVACGLTGPIPSSFGRLTSLTLLYLSINDLSGTIPPELANCTSLTDLQLDTNQLQGTIPSQLGMLNLTTLYLFTNRLTGEVPMSIWKMETLENLLLYENRLFGELPTEVAQLKRLKQFTLFDNHFSGIIPQTLGINATSLTIIDFYNNSFTGPVPPNLCSGNQLERLVLGFNSFQGSIPSEFGNCPSLTRLIIDNSNLTGVLPDFVNNPNLLYMNLEGNRFTREIPSTLGMLTNITHINLSKNRLSGLLPKELGNLLQLQGLYLSHNALEGPVPPQLASCSRLLNLDVSHNLFNGTIPAALRTMSGLLTLDLSQNQFSGGIPTFISEFQALADLRLGGNSLGGGMIPSSITRLNALVTLNISHSGLTGDIPSGFSKLVMLQHLDLSHNHLTGTLASLSQLRVLTDLDISYNLFTGSIPPNLLKFLNSSFLGNPGLCVDCTNHSDRRHKGLTKFQTAMIALGTSAFLFAVVIGLGLLLQSRQRDKHDIEELYGDKDGNREDSFLFHKVMEATEDLNDRYIVGRGAHGTVYKASVGPDEVYAVKKLMFGSSKEGSTSMVREIETVGKVRHRNLVRLEDFWINKDYGLILYRYMHNGSLHDILHEIHPPPLLDWSIRCKIALGTAHGLAYLHFDCDPPIVHRDIKPMNILLDAELEPHISDFGIAKLLDQSSTALMSGTLRGTIGYIAPENAFTSTKSKESDVYSYGVVLLELITRKKAVEDGLELDIVKWVRSVWDEKREIEGVVDAGLSLRDDSCTREQATQVLRLALRCTQTEPSKRPSMRDVVKELEDVYAAAATRSKLK